MENLFKGVYKNKTVLVTGHTGFKGSWLTLWLKMLGANVIGYSLPEENENLFFNKLNLKNEITHVCGDVRNFEHLKETLHKHRPEIVFHLAAQSLVRESYRSPRLTYETNVLGTLNVLDAMKEVGNTSVFINVTSDKCYKNSESIYSYRETDPLGGHEPYSSSKAVSEMITEVYRNCFFKDYSTAIATVRAGNVLGGGDWGAERLIPDCVRALSQNQLIELRNPNSIRPWQYVLDALYGYLHLGSLLYLNPQKYSDSWNFGPDYDSMVSVEKVVSMFLKYWGCGEVKINNNSIFKEEDILKLDNTKAKCYLNWYPIYNIDKVLESTAQWYKANAENRDIKMVSIGQIQVFVESMLNKNIKLFELETLSK